MIAILAYRHHGVHDDVKECFIPGTTDEYVKYVDEPGRGKQPVVEEALLLSFMPSDFLPVPAGQVLLIVDDEGDDESSTAVGDTKVFRRWGKYFDAYVLRLTRRAVP